MNKMKLAEEREEIKILLGITDKKGSHVMDAKEVMKRTGRTSNAVYQSRKNGNKLDKLAAYERIQEITFPDVFGETVEEDHC